jgi:hypothetical protein
MNVEETREGDFCLKQQKSLISCLVAEEGYLNLNSFKLLKTNLKSSALSLFSLKILTFDLKMNVVEKLQFSAVAMLRININSNEKRESGQKQI